MHDCSPMVALGVTNLPLLTTIAAAFFAAWVLGLLTQRLGLSPIVGYLMAGIAIGKYTPGFVGDEHITHQLAEVGVILLMFGVGLHFHLKDLLAVRNIAIPGAVVQSLAATGMATLVFYLFGWPAQAGMVLGIAMAVASTVVLLRVLMDKGMLDSAHGHVAVGWLIVEDVFTVLVLVMLPIIAGPAGTHAGTEAAEGGGGGGLMAIGLAVVKLAALVGIVLLAGSKVVPWILIQVATLRSRELFTLTVLVFSVAIAVGAATVFGASVALGAFLAGMVVAQSPVSHQAAADALPLRDAFAVLFFVSVGMVFDPSYLVSEPLLVAAGLGVVLIVKPLAALLIVVLLKYSARTALTVAIGLSQIGEFSFILSQVAREHNLMPEEGHNVLVATAIISITLNPLLFTRIDRIEAWLKRRPALWRLLDGRASRRADEHNVSTAQDIGKIEKPLAVIVGYGPVGRVVDALLRDSGMETVIIDLNMDTIRSLRRSGRQAIYGDASREEVLKQAGIEQAVHLVVTLPHVELRTPLVLAARELNPKLEVTVRARYLQEKDELKHSGAATVVSEEGEAGIALARHVMERRGVDPVTINSLLGALRKLWGMDDK